LEYRTFWWIRADRGEKSARECAKLTGPQAEPRAYYLLGAIQANKSDFTAAAQSFRTFLKLAPDNPEKERAEKMLAEAERLGQTKLEQSKADTTQQR
jgi:TolA-binding protein